MGTASFPGVRQQGRGVNHTSSSSAEVKEEDSYASIPHWAFVTCSTAKFNLLYFIYFISLYFTLFHFLYFTLFHFTLLYFISL
jgi:hypothetical protein